MTTTEYAGTQLVRPLQWERTQAGRQALARKEWLVTNGLGGYASGTVSGALTRRYHALLVAALPTPFGRTVMLNFLWEQLRWPDGHAVPVSNIVETGEGTEFDASHHLTDFRLEHGAVDRARPLRPEGCVGPAKGEKVLEQAAMRMLRLGHLPG